MVDFVSALQAAATGLSVVKELSQINKAYDEAAFGSVSDSSNCAW